MFLVSPSNRFAMDAWHILAEIHGIDIEEWSSMRLVAWELAFKSTFLGIIVTITQK